MAVTKNRPPRPPRSTERSSWQEINFEPKWYLTHSQLYDRIVCDTPGPAGGDMTIQPAASADAEVAEQGVGHSRAHQGEGGVDRGRSPLARPGVFHSGCSIQTGSRARSDGVTAADQHPPDPGSGPPRRRPIRRCSLLPLCLTATEGRPSTEPPSISARKDRHEPPDAGQRCGPSGHPRASIFG